MRLGIRRLVRVATAEFPMATRLAIAQRALSTAAVAHRRAQYFSDAGVAAKRRPTTANTGTAASCMSTEKMTSAGSEMS